MQSYDYIIIGAGFAGAATAYQLARWGAGDILVLEQEESAGFHSSGRNAAMIRQCVPDPALARLARDGAKFLREIPNDWPLPVQFRQNGSLLLGSGEGWEKLKHDAAIGREMGIEVVEWTRPRAVEHVAVLENADFDGAIWCATDGIIDIHALLTGYLRAATQRGANVRFGARVARIQPSDRHRFEVETNIGSFNTNNLINAGGAWANVIGSMAGAKRLPLSPCRRHLFVSAPLPWADKGWPFVWDVSHDIYFRPEGEGLLLCACDQTELPPGDPPLDPAVQETLAEKIHRWMPRLTDVTISRSWAGLRTLTDDGCFVIGGDPKVAGLFWVAGLGGHGVTTSAAVGNLAASLLLGDEVESSHAYSPGRFSQGHGGQA